MNLPKRWNQNLTIIAIVALLVIDFVSPSIINAQNIRINYINTDNFPVIEAGYVATNSDGIKIYNSTAKDFAISENSRSNKILEVTNPKKEYQAVSIVLMIDISISMEGRKLNLVKEGMVDFIDQIPLETSEIALACFSDESYIYTDFTQSRNRLISSLEKLKPINGTNFDNAFLNKEQGALAISQGGRNKKVVIFVTDGLGSTDAEKIGALANQMKSTIFTLNIGSSSLKELKNLTENTGGQYFERIWNQAQFRSAASAIFRQLECTDFGIIKWLSYLDCEAVKPVQFKYKNASLDFEYKVPADKIGKIDINPSLLQFGAGKVGMKQSQNLSIQSQNIPLTIKSFDIDSASLFKISDSIKFPLYLKSGETFNTKIGFTATEAGLYDSNIKINFEECPATHVNLRAGGEEQIKLLFPKGGEVFIVGEDTSILWDGVKKTQPVEISFRLAEKDNWSLIDKANNLSYLWTLPSDTSSRVQIKLTPKRMADENMEVSAIIEGNNSPVVSAFFSPDGNSIITADKNGFVKTWNTQTGKILKSLGGYDVKKAILTADNEKMLLFLNDETYVWNLTTDKLAGRISEIGKKVHTSYILPDGKEVLMGGNVSIDPAKNAKIWTGVNSTKTFLLNQPDIKWASFTPDSKFTITLDGKNNVKVFKTDSAELIQTVPFKETVSEIIISPDGTKALIKLSQEICMLDLCNQTELYRIPKEQYRHFSPSGKYFITEENNKSKKLIESSTGKCVLSFTPRLYEVSPASGFVLFSQQDSVILYNLNKQKSVLSFPRKTIGLARFDASESKVYLLASNNALEIYDTNTGTFLGNIAGFSRRIKDLSFNTSKTQIAFVMEDNRIEVWSPGKNVDMKEAVSDKFTLTSPKPSIIDTIQFNEQVVNTIKEINVIRFGRNNTKYPISIKRIEFVGKDSTEFKLVSNTFPIKIDANSQLDEEFQFTPTNLGIREAIVKTYTTTDTFSTVISGKGVNQKVLPLLRYIDFGKVKVGQYKDTLASILVNIGKDTLVIRDLNNFGPDSKQFILLSNPLNKIAPNDTLKALMRFQPVLRGKTTTAFILTPSSDNGKIMVRGEGVAPKEIILTGTTRNSADSLSIQAKVIMTDLDADHKMEEVTTGQDGKFSFKLMADRNYGIIAEKDNFISTSLNIDLSEKVMADTIKQDLYLTEIKPGAIIRFNCIFFEIGKASILPGSQSDLKRLLDVILKYKINSFEIHGHTDSQGSEELNLNLSKARAASVMNYLIKNGVQKERLSIRYFGETRPVADNSTEEGRALNRRVELKVAK